MKTHDFDRQPGAARQARPEPERQTAAVNSRAAFVIDLFFVTGLALAFVLAGGLERNTAAQASDHAPSHPAASKEDNGHAGSLFSRP